MQDRTMPPKEMRESDEALPLSQRDALKAGMGAAVSAQLLSGAAGAYAQTTGGNATTLVIASHPYPERSVVNKALQQTARATEGVMFRNLETIYGDNIRGIDVGAERSTYHGMRRIVFMFPIHWFNLTPLLKAYLNEVWTIWSPQTLKGMEMLVVTTAGAEAGLYTHDGRVGLTIEEVLAPMRASANYAGMTYLEPLAFLGVTGADEARIRRYQGQLSERLRQPVEPRTSAAR